MYGVSDAAQVCILEMFTYARRQISPIDSIAGLAGDDDRKRLKIAVLCSTYSECAPLLNAIDNMSEDHGFISLRRRGDTLLLDYAGCCIHIVIANAADSVRGLSERRVFCVKGSALP